MKNLLSTLALVTFSSIILIGCGGSIDNGSWSGKENIAGVVFDFKLTTSPDGTYELSGTLSGMAAGSNGTYTKINDNEIELTSGEFSGERFVKDGSSLEWYNDNGDFVMTLD